MKPRAEIWAGKVSCQCLTFHLPSPSCQGNLLSLDFLLPTFPLVFPLSSQGSPRSLPALMRDLIVAQQGGRAKPSPGWEGQGSVYSGFADKSSSVAPQPRGLSWIPGFGGSGEFGAQDFGDPCGRRSPALEEEFGFEPCCVWGGFPPE